MPFVFYDLETSGLDDEFDQIFQFGAIYTDDQLNKIDEINLRCRRRPEVVPSPGAMLVTNLRPEDIEKQNLSHYQMVRQILDWLAPRCPATFIGHNSLDFDEGFMRRTFYRTLAEPYLTLMNGNSRGDTMVIAQAIFNHEPHAIDVPVVNGKLSFKLGPLARSYGIDFEEHTAHDALADVKATLELAKAMKSKSPRVWQQMLANTTKAGVEDVIENNDYFYLSAVWFGKSYGFAVTLAGRSVANNKELALFDLRYDPIDYLEMDVANLVKTLGRSPKVIRVVKGNAQPILMPPHLPGKQNDANPSIEVLKERAAAIKSNESFRQRLSEAIPQRYEPKEPSVYVEQQLYDGFFADEDTALRNLFHTKDWAERIPMAERFTDPRLRQLAKRLLAEEAPSLLSEVDRDEYRQWVSYRLSTKESVPWNRYAEEACGGAEG